MRGPFEPPDKADGAADSGLPPGRAPEPGQAEASAGPRTSQAARASVWSPSTAKMDQIKDLYLTAEAIGEDALDQNFDLVSDRQRQLIREYFNQVGAIQADGGDVAS
jgi:hypothetical protein